MWFDGQASRCMGDVAVCRSQDAVPVEPIRAEFEGTLVGLLGERNGKGPKFRVKIDGQPLLHRKGKSEMSDIWTNDTAAMGGGNLFSWIELSDTLRPGRHRIEIEPVFDGASMEGELRIESICSAGR